MRASAPDTHQRPADPSEKLRALSTSSSPPPVIKPIREPLQHPAPISDRQAVDKVQHEDCQRIGQPVGRQFGRRSCHRLGGA